MFVEKSILYFTEAGEPNTDKVLEVTKRRAEELGIRDVIVASTWGGTGVKTV